MGHLLFALLLTATLSDAPAPATAARTVELTPAQTADDLRLLQRGFVELHPGLYRYNSPQQIEAEFAAAKRRLGKGASIAAMFLEVSRLAAVVRCGHTWTNPLNQSETVIRQLFLASDKLPVRLRVVEDRFLITASTESQLHRGDELLAIDGRTAASLIAELMPFLRADGSNNGKRLSQIDSGVNGGAMDRLFPLLHPPADGHYILRYRKRSGDLGEAELSVTATSVAIRESLLSGEGDAEPSPDWNLSFEGSVAILTIPTFAFWHADFDWNAFLNESFAELKRRGIAQLVIDLRRDEGGDGAVGDALLAHLLRATYKPPLSRPEVSFERVPYDLARHLDTWNFGFFDHTGNVQRTAGRNFHLLALSEGGYSIKPVQPTFRGKVIALIGPQMSSAGFIIARNLQKSGAAVLVGQPTGGNLRGMNGGQLAWLTLPHSGIAVDIPLIAWMPVTQQPDQTVLPDVMVTPSFDLAAAGVDADMQAALALLGKRSPLHEPGLSSAASRMYRLDRGH